MPALFMIQAYLAMLTNYHWTLITANIIGLWMFYYLYTGLLIGFCKQIQNIYHMCLIHLHASLIANLPEKIIISQGLTIFLMVRLLFYRDNFELEMSTLFSQIKEVKIIPLFVS